MSGPGRCWRCCSWSPARSASLIASSLRSTDTGAFTLENYVIAYGDWHDIQALGNSLLYALEATVLSALFAVPIAWGVSRTDMPGKRVVQVLTSAPSSRRPIWVPSPGSCWRGRMRAG